jgi:hypothetical protein
MKIKMKKKQQGHGRINKHTTQNKKNNNKQQVTIKSKTKCQKQISIDGFNDNITIFIIKIKKLWMFG